MSSEKFESLKDLSYSNSGSRFNSVSSGRNSSFMEKKREEILEKSSKISMDEEMDEERMYELEMKESPRVSILVLILWFIIIAMIVFLILYAWKPEIVQQTDSRNNPTGEASGIKILVASLIVSAVITFLLFLFLNVCA